MNSQHLDTDLVPGLVPTNPTISLRCVVIFTCAPLKSSAEHLSHQVFHVGLIISYVATFLHGNLMNSEHSVNIPLIPDPKNNHVFPEVMARFLLLALVFLGAQVGRNMKSKLKGTFKIF